MSYRIGKCKICGQQIHLHDGPERRIVRFKNMCEHVEEALKNARNKGQVYEVIEITRRNVY